MTTGSTTVSLCVLFYGSTSSHRRGHCIHVDLVHPWSWFLLPVSFVHVAQQQSTVTIEGEEEEKQEEVGVVILIQGLIFMCQSGPFSHPLNPAPPNLSIISIVAVLLAVV